MDIDIDLPSHKRDLAFQVLNNFYNQFGGSIVRVCTFGTESSRSAILTSCRGLKINNDIAMVLSSLIPVERGFVWDIEDCYYGNEEKERQPIIEFKNLVDEYSDKGLLKVALGIQGLVNKRGIHPCGSILYIQSITNTNALMRSPSGELTTQFNLEDSEYLGDIKYDLLNTKTCGMIQVCLEMLVEYKKIKWEGSLRKTYDKLLNPDILDKTTPKLWESLYNGELISAFQFDSPVGEQALAKIKPQNLIEVTSANTLMRLMSDGEEQPIDKYVRYK